MDLVQLFNSGTLQVIDDDSMLLLFHCICCAIVHCIMLLVCKMPNSCQIEETYYISRIYSDEPSSQQRVGDFIWFAERPIAAKKRNCCSYLPHGETSTSAFAKHATNYSAWLYFSQIRFGKRRLPLLWCDSKGINYILFCMWTRSIHVHVFMECYVLLCC